MFFCGRSCFTRYTLFMCVYSFCNFVVFLQKVVGLQLISRTWNTSSFLLGCPSICHGFLIIAGAKDTPFATVTWLPNISRVTKSMRRDIWLAGSTYLRRWAWTRGFVGESLWPRNIPRGPYQPLTPIDQITTTHPKQDISGDGKGRKHQLWCEAKEMELDRSHNERECQWNPYVPHVMEESKEKFTHDELSSYQLSMLVLLTPIYFLLLLVNKF